MHSNILLGKDGLLSRGNTSICVAGGWSKSIKVIDNSLYIDSDVKTIKCDCFGYTFIGPGAALIFEDYVALEHYSITSPQFKHIVFKKDASIDEKAFFLKECNSNLYKHYVLYCYRGSSVEKFAIEHGFKFKTLDKFEHKKKKSFPPYCNSSWCWLSFRYKDYRLYIGEDDADLIKQAKEENGYYLYYHIPFKRKQYTEQIKKFLQLFRDTAPEEDKKHLLGDCYLILKGETVLKYFKLLEKCFKNDELIEKFNHLSKENQ